MTIDMTASSLRSEAETLPCRREEAERFCAESPADLELAKTLCHTCPVRAECLAGALERREPWGVWGGEIFLQGVVIPRKRPVAGHGSTQSPRRRRNRTDHLTHDKRKPDMTTLDRSKQMNLLHEDLARAHPG